MMRWLLSSALAILGVACDQGASDIHVDAFDATADGLVDAELRPDSTPPDPTPWLRLNHIQMRGTHNSYHRAPDEPALDLFAFDQPPLAEQLGVHGVRQLELDIHEAGEGRFDVYHLPAIDDQSSCPTLRACLAEVEAWSVDNPGHHALFIFIEPKSSLSRQAAELDSVITEVWPRERIVTPSDVRGQHPDLATALAATGWPSIHDTRGKALFFLFDDQDPRDRYRAAQPDPLLFVRHDMADAESPDAVFFNRDEVDPLNFPALIDRRQLVRTRGEDPDNRQDALDIGVHMISLDDGAALAIPGGTPSRCNPRTAPPECTPELIETP